MWKGCYWVWGGRGEWNCVYSCDNIFDFLGVNFSVGGVLSSFWCVRGCFFCVSGSFWSWVCSFLFGLVCIFGVCWVCGGVVLRGSGPGRLLSVCVGVYEWNGRCLWASGCWGVIKSRILHSYQILIITTTIRYRLWQYGCRKCGVVEKEGGDKLIGLG